MEELTKRQEEVLKTIYEFVKTKGYVPTIIELSEALKINIKTCYEFLIRLKNKGYIDRREGSARGIILTEKTIKKFEFRDGCEKFDSIDNIDNIDNIVNRSSIDNINSIDSINNINSIYSIYRKDEGMKDIKENIKENINENINDRRKKIPIVGRVVAGAPVFSEVDIEGDIIVDRNKFPKDNYFALKVRGDSMIEAGIYEGDYVIVEPIEAIEVKDGDIVVAMIDGEVTLKRIFINKNEGKCILHPENKNLKDIVVKLDEVEIIGKIVGLQRFY